jgi:hypothetical protein
MEQALPGSGSPYTGHDRRRPGRMNYGDPSLIRLLRGDFTDPPARARKLIVQFEDPTPAKDATPLALLVIALWTVTIVLAVTLSP